VNVYQTASAIRFADAVLKIGQQYHAADRWAKASKGAIEGARKTGLDTTAMEAIHASDCKRADAVYATLTLLLMDVTKPQKWGGITGQWRVRVEWNPKAEKDKLNVYAQVIED
jgi:hypothetical protein